MTWAGRSRSRSLALPVSARTSRTRSSGNVLAITPRLMWSLRRMPAGRPAGARAMAVARPTESASIAQPHAYVNSIEARDWLPMSFQMAGDWNATAKILAFTPRYLCLPSRGRSAYRSARLGARTPVPLTYPRSYARPRATTGSGQRDMAEARLQLRQAFRGAAAANPVPGHWRCRGRRPFGFQGRPASPHTGTTHSRRAAMWHHPSDTVRAGLAGCILLTTALEAVAADPGAPDMKGTWRMEAKAIVAGTGAHWPAEVPPPAEGDKPRLGDFKGTMQVTGQEGGRF